MATTSQTLHDPRTLGAEFRDLIERFYGIASADGDDILSERCSIAMDTWDTLAAMTPFSLHEGGTYVTRDGHMAIVLRLDYQQEFRGTFGATVLVMLRKPGTTDTVDTYRRNGAYSATGGAVPHDLDIVGYWHGGLSAHVPALPQHQLAAE